MTKQKTKLLWILAAVLCLLAIGGGVGYYCYRQYQAELAMMEDALAPDVYYQGISVSGVALGGMTKAEAKAALKEVEPTLRDPIALVLNFEDHEYTYTQDDFSYTYDTDKVLENAFAVARTGELKDRYQEQQALLETPKEFSITATLNTETVADKVKNIAAEIDRAKTEAKVLAFTPGEEEPFSFQKGQDGYTVDQANTISAIETVLAAETKEATIDIVVTIDPCTTTTEDAKKDIAKIASFSTIANNTADARYNMKKALGLFNGTVLQAGESFSYNSTVGNSSLPSNGWRSASTLSGGKVVQDYGGGVCQAATTLYGAVLRADLTILERDSHRWPSSYVPIGQDATISYGNIDFRFQNPYDTPIYIEAYMTDDVNLHVNIYGRQPEQWDTIELNSWTTETVKPEKTIRKDDATLEKGKEEVDVEARDGYRAAGEKVFYKDGEVVKEESIASSYYRPVQGVILVGTKTDKKTNS